MKNNKLLFLVVLMMGGACTKRAPETLISRFEQKSQSYSFAERKLASSPQGKCLINLFNVETLKEEVSELEKQYSAAQKVRGRWKHLDLSQLPVPQANFLRNYGDDIGDLKDKQSIDYSSCQDLPCIFNKVYGKEGHVAGYVHYLWYLKFGHMLSLDNKVPSQSSNEPGVYGGQSFPLSAYLYDDKELYGIWRLSQMLKSPHTTLRYMTELQRIPRGVKFEDSRYAGACGLASSAGWIILQDGCLSTLNNPDTGFLYQAIAHELTHQIDFEQGRGTSFMQRSSGQQYLDLAGMYMEEYVNSSGVTVRQWKLKPNAKIVSSYAGTSPAENFAESIALFRVDGDRTKKEITPDHYKFVSTEFFQGRLFEKEEMMKTWISNYSSESMSEVFKAVIDCSKNPGTTRSTFFTSSDFTVRVLPNMLNCIGGRATEISALMKGKATLYEPDGCMAINAYETRGKWDIHMKNFLKGAFNKYLQELNKDPQYLARIQAFYKEISDPTIARNSYVSCFKESQEESCYQEELQKNFYEKASRLNFPEEQIREMTEMYSSNFPYAKIKAETITTYQVFVSSHLEKIRESAGELWQGCHNISHNDDQIPTGKYFSITDGYMISSFYNCLNMNIPDTVRNVIGSFSVDEFKVEHPKEELILSQEILPHVVKYLQERYLKEREVEVSEASVFVISQQENVKKQLLSDFSWVKDVSDSSSVISDCKREGSKLVPMTLLYNMKGDIFGRYIEENICQNISSTPEFNEWMNTSPALFKDQIFKQLEESMLNEGRRQADMCLRSYPMDTNFNRVRYKIQREKCLLDTWPTLEYRVIREAMKDPLVIRTRMPEQDLRNTLQINRRSYQQRLMKEKFYFNLGDVFN